MDKVIRIGALVLVFLLVIFTSLMFYSLGNGGNIGSVGIIGGSDGPTAVFLGGPNSASLMFVLSVTAFALAALLIWYKKPKSVDYEWGAEEAIEGVEEDES